jgi:hypothetical protein
VALQQQINRFADLAPNKFTPIVVDGFIGTGTVAALVLAMKKSPLSIGFALDPGWEGLTKERVAANAAAIASRLNSAATMLSAPAAPPVPVAQQTPPDAAAAAAAAAQAQADAAAKGKTGTGGQSNTVWWIVGGLGTLAVVGIVTATVIRSKRRRKGGAAPSFAGPHFGTDIFPFPY